MSKCQKCEELKTIIQGHRTPLSLLMEEVITLMIQGLTLKEIAELKILNARSLQVRMCREGLSKKKILHYHQFEQKNPREILEICKQKRIEYKNRNINFYRNN